MRPHLREPRVFVTAEWRYLAMLNYAVEPASLAAFVPAGTEHARLEKSERDKAHKGPAFEKVYWGYVRQRAGGTLEYEVRHDPWQVWAADEAAFVDGGSGLYDPALSLALGRKPDSAFLADGSPVRLFGGRRVS